MIPTHRATIVIPSDCLLKGGAVRAFLRAVSTEEKPSAESQNSFQLFTEIHTAKPPDQSYSYRYCLKSTVFRERWIAEMATQV